MTCAPDLIEPVVAFRKWRLGPAGLESAFGWAAWRQPVLHARCLRAAERFALDPTPHDAPQPGCSCGIYALYSARSSNSGMDHPRAAWGIVTLWGRIEAHAGGMRGEHARIRALAAPREWSIGRVEILRGIADTLGVSVVREDELEAVAGIFGRRLGPDLRPRSALSAVPLSVPYREPQCRVQPAFRFLFGERGGDILPWAWWSDGRLAGLDERWRGAIGDVFTLNDSALATFARVTPELRPAAEVQLRAWALEDGWELEIAPGLTPLARPATTSGTALVCDGCRSTVPLTRVTKTAFRRTHFQPSRCRNCWSRYTGSVSASFSA